MPIARVGSSLIYYAHVPKCAGSSIEDYLIERFGPLAFLNRDYRRTPPVHRWSNTSPQHIDTKALDLLFPQDFFAASFAVVRHPAARLRSAFEFQKARRHVSLRLRFDTWLTLHERQRDTAPFQHDNHLRPMTDLVPQEARVFRMEDGLDPVVAWLDELAGNRDGPREIPRANKTKDMVRVSRSPWKQWIRSRLQVGMPDLDEALCSRIYSLYKEDYDRFGYDPLSVLRKAH